MLAVAFRPDGKELCSAGLEGQLYLWDVKEGCVSLQPPAMIISLWNTRGVPQERIVEVVLLVSVICHSGS